MIITLLFIVALSWSISRGMRESALASILSERVKNVKPRIEMVIPVKEATENTITTVHLHDYLQQQELAEELEDNSIQTIKITSFPGNNPATLHLN